MQVIDTYKLFSYNYQLRSVIQILYLSITLFMKVKKIVFATGNSNKLKEIKSAINGFEIIGLRDLGITEEIPETGTTLKENALQKAKYIYDKAGVNCFSDDTGLEIKSINNRPGVY